MKNSILTVCASLLFACTASQPGSVSGPANGPASGKADGQTAEELLGEAARVKSLLDRANASIVCEVKDGDEVIDTITLAAGESEVDETGLVVTSESGDYSYGTDEIGELFARGTLLVEWGEEGNYQLVVPGFAWTLFGYEANPRSRPELDPEARAVGAVIGEGESVNNVVCRGQAR